MGKQKNTCVRPWLCLSRNLNKINLFRNQKTPRNTMKVNGICIVNAHKIEYAIRHRLNLRECRFQLGFFKMNQSKHELCRTWQKVRRWIAFTHANYFPLCKQKLVRLRGPRMPSLQKWRRICTCTDFIRSYILSTLITLIRLYSQHINCNNSHLLDIKFDIKMQNWWSNQH